MRRRSARGRNAISARRRILEELQESWKEKNGQGVLLAKGEANWVRWGYSVKERRMDRLVQESWWCHICQQLGQILLLHEICRYLHHLHLLHVDQPHPQQLLQRLGQ